jgi:integrase
VAVRQRGKYKGRFTSYTITIKQGFDPVTGKRLRDYFKFVGTKKEALAEEARLLREQQEGTYVPPNKLTMRMYLADWLRRKNGIVTARTHEGYQHIIDNHFDEAFGSVLLTKLRPLHIQNYLDKKRLGDEENDIRPLLCSIT